VAPTPRDLRIRLADNIRAAAARKEMPLNALADFAGVSRAQLYDALSGKKSVTIAWLSRLALALDVEVWELLAPESVVRRRR
jgi:transcriptional regulator with XRE-family HTH domain